MARSVLALVLMSVLLVAVAGRAQPSQISSPSPMPSASQRQAIDPKKAEALAHFERGVLLMNEEAWDAALAEFQRSRELFPARGNTQNVAICLRKLHRYDEALDAFETLLRQYPDLPATARSLAEKEVRELHLRTGLIDVRTTEIGATVVIDGRARGSTPVPAPLRVSAGSHLIRIHKDGYTPFEEQVQVVGGQSSIVAGRMTTLVRSGRLHVLEHSGGTLRVLLDGVDVGTTPWEGVVSVGEHTVLLRSNTLLGTQPSSVNVHENQVEVLRLAAEELLSRLQVAPSPVNATVELDGISVGRGVWEGMLRAGPHRVEVASAGFLPATRQVSLQPGGKETLAIELKRDLSSPLWSSAHSRFALDLQQAVALGLSVGGQVVDGCGAACSQSLASGFQLALVGGYEHRTGFGFGATLGYLVVSQRLHGRTTSLTPMGLQGNQGAVDDTLSLSGFMLGAAGWFHAGDTWPVSFQTRLGVLLGTMQDERAGTFTTNRTVDGAPATYSIGVPNPIRESVDVTYAFASPAVLFGYRPSSSLEIGLGVEPTLLVALTQPQWQDSNAVIAGNCTPTNTSHCVNEGEALFGPQTLSGKTIILVSPFAYGRWEF